MKESFVFDLEGTLVNLELQHQLAFSMVAEALGVQFGEQDFLKFVGAGDKAISVAISQMAGEDCFKVREMKNKAYDDLIRSASFEPREGVIEYLEKALVLSGDLVVATLTPATMAETILINSGLSPFFKYVLTESDVKNLKPDPEIYVKAAEKLGVELRKMLVHEDSPAGVMAAILAGSPVAAFPVHDGLNFDPSPSAIFLSWADVSPGELYERLT